MKKNFLSGTLINTAKYTLYPTDKENWCNFTAMQYNEISDFISWSMIKAFSIILKNEKGDNMWYYCNGAMVQEYYNSKREVECICTLSITANGILFLKISDKEYQQCAQYVVKMK